MISLINGSQQYPLVCSYSNKSVWLWLQEIHGKVLHVSYTSRQCNISVSEHCSSWNFLIPSCIQYCALENGQFSSIIPTRKQFYMKSSEHNTEVLVHTHRSVVCRSLNQLRAVIGLRLSTSLIIQKPPLLRYSKGTSNLRYFLFVLKKASNRDYGRKYQTTIEYSSSSQLWTKTRHFQPAILHFCIASSGVSLF